MTDLVLTALGDDRAGLVDALAAVVADHGGNWDRAEMARLGGKFAGIVLVSVPDDRVADLRAGLDDLGSSGVLDVVAVAVDAVEEAAPATALLSVSGTDRPGVLREVTAVLAAHEVSIESLDTSTVPAAMAGGTVFEASAALVVPEGTDLARLEDRVEAAVPGFLVEIDRIPGT